MLESLERIGFEEPTKIQYETIPLIKEGYDVIGQSETGSGKTAAFGIPLVEKVSRGVRAQALVLIPTRELALQIAGEFEKFAYKKGLRIQCVYGGAPMGAQVAGLRYAEIVVGTPGRIMDHMRRGTLNLKNVKTFVLDEADKMIDMGFVEDIETIERQIPEDRQTLMFSATMPSELLSIRERFTKDAKKITTETQVREEYLKQYYCDVEYKLKFSLLVHLMRQEKPRLAIIFCNSRRDVDAVCKNLKKNEINADTLHGGLTQSRREHVIADFHDGETDVLVATDVAARGLDFKKVSHIFNYNVPKHSEDYVNRIGRTARAGEIGKAIVLLSREDHDSFRRIVNIYNFDIEPMEYSDVEVLPFERNSYRDREDGGRGGFRRGGSRGQGEYHGGFSRSGNVGYSHGSHGGFGVNHQRGESASNDDNNGAYKRRPSNFHRQQGSQRNGYSNGSSSRRNRYN